MYNNVSEQFATTIRSPSRTFNLRLKINGKWIDAGFKKMGYETASTSDEGIQIGSAVAAKIEITIKRIDELFENTEIPIEIGLKLPSGKYEYIPLGFFTAEHPTLDQATTTFTAYDRMMKTTGVYVSELTYPASAESVLKEISTGCGVPCNVSGLNGITIDTAPVGYTYREVIGYIASLAGGFACVDRTGTIVIKWYEDNGYTINESRIMTFEKNESDYHLDYLTCNVDSNTSFTVGSGTLGITFDNPLTTEEKLNSVYKKVRGFAYRGASLKTLGDIRLDPWDIVTVEELGKTYKVPVMNITQEYDGGLAMTITAYGKTETETETDYKGPSTKLAERTYAEMMLTKELVAKKVDAEWVKANTVTAETIVSVNNELQYIKNNYLKSNEADIKFATIKEEKVIKSDIEQLNVKYEKVGILDGDVAGIKTLMFGSSTGESITTDFANSVVSMIGTAQIKDSMIDSLDAKKIKALDIDTTDVAVHSKDGLSRWSDNTIQISDSKRVRVQIGKDTSGDYNMYVWDVKGNLMFDALGLTEQGVQREIIRNDMVKENANISAGKLDIASLFSVINNDGTHTLKSNKIYLDDAAQTLNVLLQDIKTGSGKDYSEWGSLLKQSDDFITQKLWWTENIDGTSVKEKFSNVNQTLQEYSVSLSNLAKYDDEIYLISYVPTKDNYPAWDWCVPVYPSDTQFPREETWQYNDTEWDKYIGKVAYWESEGRAWRFIRNTDGSHGWKEIPNSETAYMLKQNSALRINLDSISSSLLLTQQDLKDNYSTTMQMNNAITQSVSKESNSIKLEVSNNYATKKNLESYATTDSLESYATTASLTAFIKNENGQLRSAIEAIADTINITARGGLNISGDRFTLASTNTTITADGTITCKKLNAKGSTIGGYAINDYTLVGAQVGISSKSGYGWAFWAGSDTPDKAPFRVGHTGEIHATNADIEGTIKSNNATITGGSIKIDTSNSGENIILLNCSSSSLGLAPDGMSVTNGSATTIIGAENIMCNQGDGSISCKKMIVSNNAEIYGSCYTYDYYYIWSEGGWMELSQWIRQKLGI
jgi:hypothetical protein|nr:MAG TPA: Minor structural protein [Caudoviricetes sp.]